MEKILDIGKKFGQIDSDLTKNKITNEYVWNQIKVIEQNIEIHKRKAQ